MNKLKGGNQSILISVHGDLNDGSSFVADLVLQVLSWVAQEERTKIKTRQAEGIALAKAQGKHLGRPKSAITNEFKEAYKQWKSGEFTAVQAMKKSNMTMATFYRRV
ncbi:resolvase [Oceanobacillus iheyensis]|nr:resolvase [Oceanobacillus iheyensis]